MSKENVQSKMTAVKVTKVQLVDMIAKEAGMTKKMSKEFLDAFSIVARDILENGGEFVFPSVGTFVQYYMPPKEARQGVINIRENIKGILPPTGAYFSPKFKINSKLRSNSRKKTEGRAVEQKKKVVDVNEQYTE